MDVDDHGFPRQNLGEEFDVEGAMVSSSALSPASVSGCHSHRHRRTASGSSGSSRRREAQYRQSPRWVSDSSCAGASVSSRLSSASHRPQPVSTGTKPRLSSPLKKHQLKQQQATSFAAAVSPRSSTAKKLRRKPGLMSTPLLGAAAAMPPPTKSRSSLRSSIRAYAGASTRKKLLPSFNNSGNASPSSSASVCSTASTTKKKKGIGRRVSKGVSKGLTKLGVKKRGKKSSTSESLHTVDEHDDASSSPYKKFHSYDSDQNLAKENVCNRSSTPTDLMASAPGILETGSGFAPLTFDEEEEIGTNQFRSERPKSPLEQFLDKTTGLCCGEYAQLSPEGLCRRETGANNAFSLHDALSPTNSLLDNIEESDDEECVEVEESPMSKEFVDFLRTPSQEDPPIMPQIDQDDISIPSMSGSPQVLVEGAEVVTPQAQVATADEGADSAIAWGALGMLLGSPAPQSVQVNRQRKRTPVNLWEDEGDLIMPSMSEDEVSLLGDGSVTPDSKAMSQEDENRIKFSEALQRAMTRRASDSEKGSTPDAFYKSYETAMIQLSSKRPDAQEEDDCCSLPSISASDLPRFLQADDIALPPVLRDEVKKDDAADATLAWGALGMLLGSPAPQYVSKKPKRRAPVNLWQDEDGGEDQDDIISLPQDDDISVGSNHSMPSICSASSSNSIPSLCSGTGEACNLPSLLPKVQSHEDFNDPAFSTPTTAKKPNDKEVADSTLAWTALAAILGSPAPSSVVKKSTKRESVNLWEDGEELDLLPEMEDEECEVFEDDASLPFTEDASEIDLNELAAADEEMEASNLDGSGRSDNEKESANSVLAWSALGMLLGAPAPKSVAKKKVNKVTKNLWDDSEEGDHALDTIPSIEHDDEIPSPLSDTPSTCQHWFMGGQESSDDDDDNHSIPSLSRMPSLAGTSDGDSDGPSSPLTVSMRSSDDFGGSFRREASSKDLADSVLAWSALSAFMGMPAPKAALPKKKKEAKDLFGEESDADLILIQDNQSSELCDVSSLVEVWEERAQSPAF